MDIYYRFYSIEYLENGVKLVLTAIFEPDAKEYVKSFLGILSPWPKVKEYKVEFFRLADQGQFAQMLGGTVGTPIWIEYSCDILCSIPLCELLEKFYVNSFRFPGHQLIGRL